MKTLQQTMNKFLFATAFALALVGISHQAIAATAADLDRDAAQALETLYKNNQAAADISKKAKAILVFPRIVKAGFIFGGSYGEGVLMKNAKVVDYYSSVSGSWGWQAGVESYGYVVFLMDNKAINYLEKSKGWELGIGPSITVVDAGVAENLSTTTLKKEAYAFIFDQKGLMASLSIEGTKISKIRR